MRFPVPYKASEHYTLHGGVLGSVPTKHLDAIAKKYSFRPLDLPNIFLGTGNTPSKGTISCARAFSELNWNTSAYRQQSQTIITSRVFSK